MRYDIDIDGSLGFYAINGNTKRGTDWLTENVDGIAPWHSVPCDDTRMTRDIADGAIDDGLTVRVNGKKYLGDNRCAA